MMQDLKPYPDYRNSGVPWLGMVPAHWDVCRNKLLFREVNDRSSDGSEELLTVSQYTGVSRRRERMGGENSLLTNAVSLVGYKRVAAGDLAINIMLAWNGSLGVSPLNGIVSPAYSVFRAKPTLDARYYHYLLRTPLFTGAFKMVSTGVVDSRLRLYPEVFFRLPSLVPPRNEQAAIVRFLDHADRTVRRYILAKQKLIELLEEQKQAIIHRAVTRGLNPDVRLKPAGIEWLEEVPENWVVVKIGRVIQLTTGFPFNGEGFSQDPDDVRLLRGINVSPDGIRWDSVVRWPIAEVDQFSAFQLHVGDIVLGMDRPVINSGTRVAMITERDAPSLLLQRVARIRPTEELDKEFALLLLQGRGFSNYLKPIFTGISVPHISPEQIRSFRVALPPVAEQRTIVRLLKGKTAAVNSAISAEQRQILLLRELRTRLIADVVTGKLDVRAAVMTLSTDDLAPELDDLLLELEEAVENGLAADLEEVEV